MQTAEDKTLTSRVLNNPDSQISDTPQGRHQEASKMSSSPEASHRSGAKSHTLTALAQIRTASVGSCYALPCLAFSQQVHRQSRTRSRQLPVLKGRPFKTHIALLRHWLGPVGTWTYLDCPRFQRTRRRMARERRGAGSSLVSMETQF